MRKEDHKRSWIMRRAQSSPFELAEVSLTTKAAPSFPVDKEAKGALSDIMGSHVMTGSIGSPVSPSSSKSWIRVGLQSKEPLACHLAQEQLALYNQPPISHSHVRQVSFPLKSLPISAWAFPSLNEENLYTHMCTICMNMNTQKHLTNTCL